MKAKLLKQLREKYSSDFIIKEDLKREYGCKFKVESPYCITYHAMSLENAKEWIKEKVNQRIERYIEDKRPKSKRYDANGNEIITAVVKGNKRRSLINQIKLWLHI